MKYICILHLILASGCTISLQIDTDYASQSGSEGNIYETAKSEETTTPTVDVTADIKGEGL